MLWEWLYNKTWSIRPAISVGSFPLVRDRGAIGSRFRFDMNSFSGYVSIDWYKKNTNSIVFLELLFLFAVFQWSETVKPEKIPKNPGSFRWRLLGVHDLTTFFGDNECLFRSYLQVKGPHMSSEGPWLGHGYIGDKILPSFIGTIINHDIRIPITYPV